MIEVFGTENKKSCIWVKCIPASGGTMVLTEPEAGSDVRGSDNHGKEK
ncbi:MAG: hypothetical protein R2874_02440 [Desulfobacterales bacterium]